VLLPDEYKKRLSKKIASFCVLLYSSGLCSFLMAKDKKWMIFYDYAQWILDFLGKVLLGKLCP
jgi:hypothetical protein